MKHLKKKKMSTKEFKHFALSLPVAKSLELEFIHNLYTNQLPFKKISLSIVYKIKYIHHDQCAKSTCMEK